MRALRLLVVIPGALAAALAVAPPPAGADGGGLGGFRCGSRIVRNGETEDDVSQKCGPPDATREWTEVQTESAWVAGRKVERSVPISFAEWKYDFGRHKLIRYLVFVQGRLRDVNTGPYGEASGR